MCNNLTQWELLLIFARIAIIKICSKENELGDTKLVLLFFNYTLCNMDHGSPSKTVLAFLALKMFFPLKNQYK